MNKTVRVVLYLLSILMVAGVIVAFILGGRNIQAGGTAAELGKEVQTDGEANMEYGSGQSEAGREEENEPVQSEAGREANIEKEIEQSETERAEGDAERAEIEVESYAQDPSWEEHAASETEKSADASEGTVTIIFTGDVLFGNAFKAGYDAKGIAGVLSEELLRELNEADILMINNEFPFSDRGEPMLNKQYTFQSDPVYTSALKEMGVDIASLANNHTLDYGKDALRDTFAALDQAGIFYAGAGNSVERAEQVSVIEVNGKKFGFLAVSRVIPQVSWKVENETPGIFSCYDDTRLLELIRQAKEQCDFLAVYPHWGLEQKEYPESYQTQIARRCIQAGADVIVGAHPHCLQVVSYIDGKPVFYSLGNFMFGRSIEQSAILKVTVDASGSAVFQLLPVYAAEGVTQFTDKEEAERIWKYMDGISSDAVVGLDGIVTEQG